MLFVVVKVNGMESNCGFSCIFIYLDVKIVWIDLVIFLVIVGDENIICIYGLGFLSGVLDLEIKIGKILCIVMFLL